MTIIKLDKRLVVGDKIKIFKLDHSTNFNRQELLRREKERQRLLNLKSPVYIDNDFII